MGILLCFVLFYLCFAVIAIAVFKVLEDVEDSLARNSLWKRIETA